MSRPHPVLLALAASVALTSGCGGSASSSKPPSGASSTQGATSADTTSTPAGAGTPLTGPQLIARADAICRRISAKRDVLNVRTPADFQIGMLQVAAYQQEMLGQFERLAAPPALAQDWGKIVADARTLAESTARVGEDIRSNNTTATRPLLATFAQARLRLRATAKAAGMKACGIY